MSGKATKRDKLKEQSESCSVETFESSLPAVGRSLIEERYEVIDGIRYDCQPSPTLHHQLLVTQLWNVLNSTCRATGTVIVAPMDVRLDEDNIVQPDLIYVSNENASILRKRIEGVPDLLIEILSPSTGEHDKIRKRALYERFGIAEYWIVDAHHRAIDQFGLLNGKYELERTYGSYGTIVSERFPCVAVQPGKLFEILDKYPNA